MSDMYLIATCFLLVVSGLLVTIHYQFVSNFLTKAPKWIPIALALTTASGIGMVICGITSNWLYGLFFSLSANTGMIAIQLAAWHSGAHISKEFARAAHYRQNRKTIFRDWEVYGEEHADSFSAVYNPFRADKKEENEIKITME